MRVFVSYAREDRKYLERFRHHTASLADDGVIIFVDDNISALQRQSADDCIVIPVRVGPVGLVAQPPHPGRGR